MKKLEIYKNGNFLNAYEENAIILHKLFNYKVIESDNHKYKCGFPLTQYNKIINGLQDNKISYIVYDKENILEDKDYLKYCKKVIEEKLNKEYKLELNKNKSMITRSSNGINFLGHRFIIKSNKTIIKITNSTKRKIKTGIRKNLNKYNNKLINYQKLFSSITNYKYSYIFVNHKKINEISW